MEKAKNTIKEIICDRKYTNFQDMNNYIKTDQVLIYFCDDSKITINHIKDFVSKLSTDDFDHGIFIYPDTITSSAKKAIELIDKKIELFEIAELQYNITKHRLVPKHQKLEGEEYMSMKTKYGSKLPYILTKDPVCRYYDFKKGDIIKINRNGNVAYRFVL